jgi:hypothetical protein
MGVQPDTKTRPSAKRHAGPHNHDTPNLGCGMQFKISWIIFYKRDIESSIQHVSAYITSSQEGNRFDKTAFLRDQGDQNVRWKY